MFFVIGIVCLYVALGVWQHQLHADANKKLTWERLRREPGIMAFAILVFPVFTASTFVILGGLFLVGIFWAAFFCVIEPEDLSERTYAFEPPEGTTTFVACLARLSIVPYRIIAWNSWAFCGTMYDFFMKRTMREFETPVLVPWTRRVGVDK